MKFALLALAAVAVAAPALAQQPQMSPAMQDAVAKARAACATDMQTYCASATDRSSRMQCMMANQDKLSESCKSASQAVMAMRQSSGGGQH